MAGENDEKVSSTKDVIDAVAGLAQAVPIYQDALQPAAQEIGKALGTIAKTVNVALAPVGLLVWGFDQMKDFVETKVTERLKHVPPENIVTPKANIAGPAMESLRYTGHEPSLSDMYANLLATAMNRDTQDDAHPAFVEIIRQLTPPEARILQQFELAGSYPALDIRAVRINGTGWIESYINYSILWRLSDIPSPEGVPVLIENMCRLGLLDVPSAYLTENGIYDQLESDPYILKLVDLINNDPERKHEFKRKVLRTTPLGRQFIDACVKSPIPISGDQPSQ